MSAQDIPFAEFIFLGSARANAPLGVLVDRVMDGKPAVRASDRAAFPDTESADSAGFVFEFYFGRLIGSVGFAIRDTGGGAQASSSGSSFKSFTEPRGDASEMIPHDVPKLVTERTSSPSPI